MTKKGAAEKRLVPPCGNRNCSTSTGIDDITLTFGSGELDDFGYWEKPCAKCAADHQQRYPNASVWPFSDPPRKPQKPEVQEGQRWISRGVDRYVRILHLHVYDGNWEVEDPVPGRPSRTMSETFLRKNYTLDPYFDRELREALRTLDTKPGDRIELKRRWPEIYAKVNRYAFLTSSRTSEMDEWERKERGDLKVILESLGFYPEWPWND